MEVGMEMVLGMGNGKCNRKWLEQYQVSSHFMSSSMSRIMVCIVIKELNHILFDCLIKDSKEAYIKNYVDKN